MDDKPVIIEEGLLLPDMTLMTDKELDGFMSSQTPSPCLEDRLEKGTISKSTTGHPKKPQDKKPYSSTYFREHPYGTRTTYMSSRAPSIQERDNPEKYGRKTPHIALRQLQQKLSPTSKLSSEQKRKVVEKVCRQFIGNNKSGPFRDLSQRLLDTKSPDFIDVADRLQVLANSCGLQQYSHYIENYLQSVCMPQANRPEILTFKY